MVINAWCGDLFLLLDCFGLSIRSVFLHLSFTCPAMSQNHAITFAPLCESRNFSVSRRDSRFEHFCTREPYLRLVYTRVECIPSTPGQEMMLVLSDQRDSSTSSAWDRDFEFFRHPRTQTRIQLADDAQISTPSLVLSPIHLPTELFQVVFPHRKPASGWPCRFRSRGTTASSMLDHDLGHLCRGRRIQMPGHSDLGSFEQNWSVLHFD